ncbi:MAG: T9SS type A sorting domain-containing protein [Saprospiraceae bacterium]|nr:T9SS type A sorting domain-containing protein [Saprospiraceae bacterium]
MKKSLYLIVAIVFFGIKLSNAQIPNSGFEIWNNIGSYSNPDSWSCMNDETAAAAVFTCTKGTPGNPGSSYLKLTSKAVTGMGIVPGIAVCGTLNTTTMQPEAGFPFDSRPANLAGNWQHMIFGNSQGFIDVTLTRWDVNSQSRITVASAHRVLVGMAMGWAAFTIPLNYFEGNNPDSCIITLSASGSVPAVNDYLWVDNLNFTGNVTGLAKTQKEATVLIYPNPANTDLLLDLSVIKDRNVTVSIYDVTGKKVLEIINMEVTEKNSIDISTLKKGSFVITIQASEGTVTRNFIKQ